MIRYLFASCALVALASPGVSLAQTAPDSNEVESETGEIVVTAQRREQSAQDVAISMTVVSPAQLETLQTSADLAKVTPNVQLDTPLGLGMSRTSIRGVAQFDFNAAATTSNMLYVDEVPLNAAISQGVPLWDLARVEVLRGPQGTLFGRNATGGAIRFISERPGSELDGYFDVTLGSYGERNIRAAVSGPLTDQLGVRLSFVSQNADGEYFNVTTNRKMGGTERYGVRGVVVWEPTDTVSIDLKAQYFEGEGSTPRFKSTPGLASQPGFEPDVNYTSIADIQAAYGFSNLGVNSNFRRAEFDADPKDTLRHIPVQLSANIDMGFATLTSVTGYLDVKQSYIVDLDGTQAPILTEYARSNSRQWTQEVRLTSPSGNRFNWIAGLFYINEKVGTNVSWDATEWLRNVGYGFPTAPTVMYTRGVSQDTASFAAFLHTDYAITDALKLTVAGRWTKERKDIAYRFRSRSSFDTEAPRTSLQSRDFVKAVDSGNLGTLLQAAQPSLSAEDSWSNFSWKVGLDYEPSSDLLVYGFVSRGFKGGAFKPTANTRAEVLRPDGSILSVSPEIITDYEIGVKSDLFDRKLRLNAGIFYYDYKDYQTNQLDLTTVTQVLSNLRKAELYGAELELLFRPVRGLAISAGGGLLGSKIKESIDPALVGNQLPFAANANFNGSISYEIQTPIGSIKPEISGVYRGQYFLTKENDSRKNAAYTTFDAKIGFNNEELGIYGSLWIRNLTNKLAVVEIGDESEFFGSSQTIFVPRRRIGVTIGARF